MMQHVNFLIIGLVTISTSLQAMKRTREEMLAIEARRLSYGDWEYHTGVLDQFTVGRNRPRYPYFVPEKDRDQSKRSFCNELLLAKKMQDVGIPRDVTNKILEYCYVEMILSNEPLIQKSQQVFNLTTLDVLCLKKEQKQALWYVLHDVGDRNQITIEGLDKDFSQKMSQNILSLPLSIRKKIVHKYGKTMESSLHNTPRFGARGCLDDEENKASFASCLAKAVSFFSIPLQSCLWDALGFGAEQRCSAIILFYCCLNKSILYWLYETPEEKRYRTNLVKIPLLQEMECEIVQK